MKKFLKALTALFAVAILAFAIVGCSNPADVSGKTYAYSDVKISGVSGEQAEIIKGAMETSLKGTEFTFEAEGKLLVNGVEAGTWTQDGDKLTFNSVVWKVNGDKIEMTQEQGGQKITIIYAPKA